MNPRKRKLLRKLNQRKRVGLVNDSIYNHFQNKYLVLNFLKITLGILNINFRVKLRKFFK